MLSNIPSCTSTTLEIAAKATGDGSGSEDGRVRTVFSLEDIEAVRDESKASDSTDDQQDNDNE